MPVVLLLLGGAAEAVVSPDYQEFGPSPHIAPWLPFTYTDFSLSLAGLSMIVGGMLGLIALTRPGVRSGTEFGKDLAILSVVLALPTTALACLMLLMFLAPLNS